MGILYGDMWPSGIGTLHGEPLWGVLDGGSSMWFRYGVRAWGSSMGILDGRSSMEILYDCPLWGSSKVLYREPLSGSFMEIPYRDPL